MKKPYDDIIDLPHHVSETRPQMSARDRAAQFSPFAALTGYDAAVKETARLTSERIELDELEQEAISSRLRTLSAHLDVQPQVAVTFFVPDNRKAGGEYITATGRVKKVDEYEGVVVLTDGRRISFTDIYELTGELFD